MDQHQNHLLATCKTVDGFGAKYAADFPATSTGGQQFAIIHSLVPGTGSQAASQVSGGGQYHAGVISKGIAYHQLHTDLLAIADAAHSLVLLGTAGLEGKFHLPRSGGDQALLNTARAFQTDAAPYSAAMIGLELDPNFLTNLGNHITNFENAIAAKGSGQSAQGGATGALADSEHRAAVALQVLNTIVRLKYKNDPAKLAEWVIASHVEKHTPVPHKTPAPAPEPKTP